MARRSSAKRRHPAMAASRVARAADPARFSMEKARGVARRMAAALPRMSGAGDFYREMGHLYAIAERACETVLTAHRPSAPIVCRKGCPYCCRVRVEVTVPEVLYMAEHLRRKLPPGDRKALAGRMDDVRRRTAGADEQGWVLANAECPFLVDDCCWVHPVRPFACRSVTSMDIDGCRRFYERRDPAVRISQYAYQRQVHTACEMGLVSAVRHAGCEARWVEMTGALAAALERPELIGRWLAGEVLFAEHHVAHGDDRQVDMLMD